MSLRAAALAGIAIVLLVSSCAQSSQLPPSDLKPELIVLEPSDFPAPSPFRHAVLPAFHGKREPATAIAILESAPLWEIDLATEYAMPYGQVLDLREEVNFYSGEGEASDGFKLLVSKHEQFGDYEECWRDNACCPIGDEPFEYTRTLSSGIGAETAIFECLWYGIRSGKPSPEYHAISRLGTAVIDLDLNYTWGFPEQRDPNDREARELLEMAVKKIEDWRLSHFGE